MRYLKRLAEPDILIKKKKEWTEKFIISGKKRPDSSKYAHQKIKDTLFAMSYTKCFYCEAKLKREPKEIDHFIEVSEDKSLAFEWDNLFLACDNCNRKIPNRSISVSDVLNPCEDSDEEIRQHIDFEDEQIRPLTEKGNQTIQKFRLDSELLDHRRLKQWQYFVKELVVIQETALQNGRKINENERERLRRYAKSDSSYSLMFIKTLQKHKLL